MEHQRQAVIPSDAEVGRCVGASPRDVQAGAGGTVLCVSEELADVASQYGALRARLLQLEGALVTARAESVLLRRLLARVEDLHSEDLVTLDDIEEACQRRGHEPDSGQPVALWIEAALEARNQARGKL